MTIMTSPYSTPVRAADRGGDALPAAAQAPADAGGVGRASAARTTIRIAIRTTAQPDFYVATLNTNLRLPKGKMAFRLTHRFLRTLGDGDFGDLAARFFGLDSGAQIGLDLKYAPFRGGQIGIYRTSDRTIQLQGQYNLIKDGNGPIGVERRRQRRRHRQLQRRVLAGRRRSCCRASSAIAARSTCSRRTSATPT